MHRHGLRVIPESHHDAPEVISILFGSARKSSRRASDSGGPAGSLRLQVVKIAEAVCASVPIMRVEMGNVGLVIGESPCAPDSVA
jgi:hypothetical protein